MADVAALTNTCPACGAEESFDSLLARMIDDATTRALIANVLAWSLPVGKQLVSYMRLHKPPKHRLSMAKVARLLDELVPAITAGEVKRAGRTWPTCRDTWSQAFEAVQLAVDKGTLVPPLTGNGYLFEVIMRMADKAEASAEAAAEVQRRTTSSARTGAVGVRGGFTSVVPAFEHATPQAPTDPTRTAAMAQAARDLSARIKLEKAEAALADQLATMTAKGSK